jgi:uncharacterized protein (TIGR00369 family)
MMSTHSAHFEAAGRFRKMMLSNDGTGLRSQTVFRTFEGVVTNVNEANKSVEFDFNIPESSANFAKIVHGGTIATLIYDTCSIAAISVLGVHCFLATAELSMTFVQKVKPGKVSCRSSVVSHSSRMARAESELSQDNAICARGRSLILIDLEKPVDQALVAKSGSA